MRKLELNFPTQPYLLGIHTQAHKHAVAAARLKARGASAAAVASAAATAAAASRSEAIGVAGSLVVAGLAGCGNVLITTPV